MSIPRKEGESYKYSLLSQHNDIPDFPSIGTPILPAGRHPATNTCHPMSSTPPQLSSSLSSSQTISDQNKLLQQYHNAVYQQKIRSEQQQFQQLQQHKQNLVLMWHQKTLLAHKTGYGEATRTLTNSRSDSHIETSAVFGIPTTPTPTFMHSAANQQMQQQQKSIGASLLANNSRTLLGGRRGQEIEPHLLASLLLIEAKKRAWTHAIVCNMQRGGATPLEASQLNLSGTTGAVTNNHTQSQPMSRLQEQISSNNTCIGKIGLCVQTMWQPVPVNEAFAPELASSEDEIGGIDMDAVNCNSESSDTFHDHFNRSSQDSRIANSSPRKRSENHAHCNSLQANKKQKYQPAPTLPSMFECNETTQSSICTTSIPTSSNITLCDDTVANSKELISAIEEIVSSTKEETCLVSPTIRGHVPDSAYIAFAQMIPCKLKEEDQIGKNRNLPVGLPGLCCKYCNGSPGCGRFFPSTFNSFVNGTNPDRIVAHVGHICTNVPAHIRETIQAIEKSAGPKPLISRYGAKKLFFTSIWRKIQMMNR